MTIHFAGTEMVQFAGAGWGSTADTGYYDQNYVRSAQTVGPNQWASATVPVPLSPNEGEGVWGSVRYAGKENRPAQYLTRHFIVGVDINGSWVFAVRCNTDFRTSLWNSENVESAIRQTWIYPQRDDPVFRLCFNYFQDGTTLKLRLYLEGVEIATSSLENETGRSIARVAFRAPSGYGSDMWGVSEVMIADENLIGHRLRQLTPVSNGDKTEWGGSYADIDERNPDGTTISAALRDSESTFNHDKVLTPNIKNLILAGNATAEAGVTFSGVLRGGGVSKASQFAYPSKWPNYHRTSWDEDPFSKGAFVPASVSGLQFGVRR